MRQSFFRRVSILALPLLVLGASLAQPVRAQSSCASDGQPHPATLLERFISADCRDCWDDAATPRARRGDLALDWVLPGTLGDEAPLSAVASRDGLKRLEALKLAAPARMSHEVTPVSIQGRLRVAHGLPVSGYIGASMGLQRVQQQAAPAPWTAWLALVEIVPMGTEGSPVTRNLVRNLLQPLWDGRKQLSKGEHLGFLESRVMNIPAGADPSRLAVIGWVEDASGHVFAAAQSRCRPAR